MDGSGSEGAKKRRKCISKTERLAKKALAGTLTEEQRLQQMHTLLASSRSEDWDAANRLVACRATQVLFLTSLLQKHQGRAAAHYMKRWSLPAQFDLSELLKTPSVLAALDANASTAATFLNTCADSAVALSPRTLYFLLNHFVLPWIANEQDAPLQALLHNFSRLKWLLLEHALVTGQGRHLINQYAYVCKQLKGSKASLSPWWSNELQERSTADTRERIRQAVEAALGRVWPDASVHLFGSSKTNLCHATDDVDLCVVVPSCDVRGSDSVDLAVDMHGHLALYFPDPDAVVVRNARIPVIKTKDAETQLCVDLCINNMAALWNTALIAAFLQRFPVLEPLCRCVRHWAKARALVGASHMLSSYSMVLLVIHWLQVRGVVPFVDVPYSDSLDPSGIDATISQAFDDAGFASDPTDGALPPVSELLVDFFVFWASEFPYATHVASLRRRGMAKEGKSASSSMLFLEDPIETTRNLGAYLNRDTHRILRNEMVRVCVLVRQWQVQLPPSLLLQSVLFDDDSLDDHAMYAPDALPACIVRRRAAHANSFTMSGDVVFRERSRLEVSMVSSGNDDAHQVVAMAFRRGVVGVDCEGVALGRTGSICIVSIAVGSRVFLFDVLTNPSLMEVVKPLLESSTTLKVLHDCRKDSDALFHQFGIVLTNVFDTQVGHAVSQLQHVKKVKEGSKCMQISPSHVIPLGNANHECIAFSDLLWQCLSIYEPDKHHVKASMTRATWTARPLTAQLMHYAAVDVLYLPVLYRVLAKSLTADGLELAQQRTAKYLSSRDWTYALPSAVDATEPAVAVGQIVSGFINNVTQKNIYVSISPSIVAAVAVSNAAALPPEGTTPLHVGDAVWVCVTAVDAPGVVLARFHVVDNIIL